MTTHGTPAGEERHVERVGGVTIDGAPIAYVIALAAVVVVLSFVPIPISLVLGVGKPFPMSQVVYPLAGILLGPWAGALAAGVGRLIGLVTAPLTATGLFSTAVAMVTAAAAGIFVQKKGKGWLLAVAVLILAFLSYVGMGMAHGIGLGLALRSTWVNTLGILLWILPTRRLARDWIAGDDLSKLFVGLLLACWIVNTSCYIVANALFYISFPTTAPQWELLTFQSPIEHAFRTALGAVLGLGVISGLRAIGLVKPRKAGY